MNLSKGFAAFVIISLSFSAAIFNQIANINHKIKMDAIELRNRIELLEEKSLLFEKELIRQGTEIIKLHNKTDPLPEFENNTKTKA